MKITNNHMYGNQEALILLLPLVEDIEEKLGELQADEDANAQIVMAKLE